MDKKCTLVRQFWKGCVCSPIYIGFGNARYFIDVDKNKYELVPLYNRQSRIRYIID